MNPIDPAVLYILERPQTSILGRHSLNIYNGEQGYTLLSVGVGGHQYICKSGKSELVPSAMLYLIPYGDICTIKALNSDLPILIVRFRPNTNLCRCICPSTHIALHQLYGIGLGAQRPETNAKGSKVRPRRALPHCTSLYVSTGMELWVRSIGHLLQYSDISLRYFDNKIEELFHLLDLDYKPYEAIQFLRFYHCRIEGFRERIMKKLSPQTDVSELYEEGEHIGLNASAFKRSFLEEFGQSPREWLAEQRARMIYKELALSDKPFKDLSEEFGFCSVSHFGVFCKHSFGDTPLHIRRTLQSNAPMQDNE